MLQNNVGEQRHRTLNLDFRSKNRLVGG